MLKAVELFCQHTLQEIKEEHLVDGTFEDRLRGYLPEPVCPRDQIPFRYLLHMASRIYLYKFPLAPDNDNAIFAQGSLYVVLSDDGKKLACVGSTPMPGMPEPPILLTIWNLEKKTCVAMHSIPKPDLFYPADWVESIAWIPGCDKRVILFLEGGFMTVSSQTGKVEVAHAADGPAAQSLSLQNKDSVLILEFRNKLFSVHPQSGHQQLVAHLETSEETEFTVMKGIINDRWLVVIDFHLTENRLRVLDMNNGCREASRHLFECSVDETCVKLSLNKIYVCLDRGINGKVLKLDESGNIYFDHAFSCEADATANQDPQRMTYDVTLGSSIFNSSYTYPNSWVTVNSLVTGKLEIRLHLPMGHRFSPCWLMICKSVFCI